MLKRPLLVIVKVKKKKKQPLIKNDTYVIIDLFSKNISPHVASE